MRSERGRRRSGAAPDRRRERRRRRRRSYVGFTVGWDRVVAVELVRGIRGVRPGRVWVRPLDPPGVEAGSWPALGDALAELAEIPSIAGATVHVALLRPIGRTKVLRVPPVRRSELRTLVAGNIRRFFLDGPAAGLADARRLRGPGGPARAVAAVADAAAVDAVVAEVTGAGFRVGGITTAAAALVEAVVSLAPALRRGSVELRVVARDWRERILLDRGEPREIHPLPPAASPEPGPAGDAPADAAGDAGDRGPDRRIAFGPGGADLAGARGLGQEPAALAAFGAVLLAGAAPQPVPDGIREEWRRRAGRRTAGLLSLAAALVVASCGAHYWGLVRELEAVRAGRRAIVGPVAETLAARDAVRAVRTRLEAIARAESGRHAWAERLATLASALPDSAHLSTLVADGATLRLEGLAESTSAVVMALDSSGWFREVELAAPVVRQENALRERFTIALILEERPAPDGAGAAIESGPGAGAPAGREGL